LATKLKPTTTEWQRYYICDIGCKLEHDNDMPPRPLLSINRCADDRHRRSINSMSNMSNSRQFCPALDK
jgi:hypothetical protein